MVYETDTKEIRDARESVDEAKENIKILQIEKEISNLENIIDSLDNQIDSTNDHFDKLIEQTEAYYDNLIKGLEEYKSRWEQLAEIEEQAKMQVALKELGIETTDILNMSEEAFNSFKEQYVGVLTEMYSNEKDMIQAINDAANGINMSALNDGLNKTKENIDNLNNADFSSVKSGLDNVSGGMDSVGSSASTASAGTTTVSDDLQKMNQSTEGLDSKLSGVASALNAMPGSSKFTGMDTIFSGLADAIGDIAIALGVGDGSVGGLVAALTDINNFSLAGKDGTGLIGQFNNLKTSVDAVTGAINGTVATSQGAADASNSASPSMSAGNPGTSAGLTGAITEIGTATSATMGEGGKSGDTGGGEGVIGKFTQFKETVDAVALAIGNGEEENELSLIYAIDTLANESEEPLNHVKTLFDDILASIDNCVDSLKRLGEKMASVNLSLFSTGTVGSGFANGTVGKAFANGTGKYKGLSHDEKNALRSEYGQPELTVYPDGTTELTTQPVMSDLPKDTVIFNEDQTKKIMNGKGTILGNAYAKGNVTLPNGTVLNPVTSIQGIDIKSLQDKFLGKLDNIIVPMNSIDKNVESMVRMSNNVHTNNASQDISINIGDIQLHGVQDVNGLANAISTKLPNMLLQTITKR